MCNGRWPTQFLIATLFVGSLVPAHLAGFASAAAVTGVALFGILMTFVVAWALSRTRSKARSPHSVWSCLRIGAEVLADALYLAH